MTRPGDPPARILIVDDEPFNVDYLEQELESLGFVTETAGDGREALERIAAAPPDLVLLDVMMPGMDGISTLRVLKQDAETRLIPVVLMTALSAVEDRVRGIEAGADDFLSKPVHERELFARIRTALRAKRAIDETVGELRATSAHLERYGRRTRHVAVLAAAWRVSGAEVPDAALGFLGRRRRAAATEEVLAHGGTLAEGAPDLLVAVFEGAEPRSGAGAAVEAALALVAAGADPAEVTAGLAVSAGSACVGSVRSEQHGRVSWAYGVDGAPLEQAAGLARAAGDEQLMLAADAAALVGDRFHLEAAADGGYRVLGAAEATPVRGVRTILVTDIVGSTRMLERLGDRAWSELVAAFDRAARGELARFGGDVVNTTGDGFLAAFETPAPAIGCAQAVVDRVAELGMGLRAGLYTAEVELVEGRAQGIALNIATRIAARANPGEVLVGPTTRDLATGSGLAFADRGEHRLEGVSEPRRLFTVVDPAAAAPPPPGERVEYPAGLTAREVDVLRLVATGLSDAETAGQLFLSVRTVHAHLRSIYRKLGVRSRAAAGRAAERHGLLEPHRSRQRD